MTGTIIKSNYDKFPEVPVRSGKCLQGWEAIIAELSLLALWISERKRVIAVECYHGVYTCEIADALKHSFPRAAFFYAKEAMKNEEAIKAMVQPFVTDDPVFGKMTTLELSDYFSEVKMQEQDVLILDTRQATVFTKGFVPGSISIGLEGRFAEWAGSILPFDKPMILVTEAGKEEESVVRLSRVGFEKMQGYLKGGFEAWQAAGEPIDMIIDVEADELAMDIPHDPNLVIVDVRRETEFADGHIKDAQNLPLNEMNDLVNLAQFEDNQNLYVHCAGGYRSVIAASLLKRQGAHNLRNVLGGWNQIKQQKNIRIEKETSVLN
mgnify:CR=1 FL=1